MWNGNGAKSVLKPADDRLGYFCEGKGPAAERRNPLGSALFIGSPAFCAIGARRRNRGCTDLRGLSVLPNSIRRHSAAGLKRCNGADIASDLGVNRKSHVTKMHRI